MRTRFAPSPTGYLHLGHAYSALTVWNVAADMGGKALLRIEDFDRQRCKPDYEQAIYDDLHWLGLDWPTPVRRISDHLPDYAAVLEDLADRGLLYPCACTRGDIKAAGGKPGWDGIVYPGTCRHRDMADAAPTDALRLNLAAALDEAGPLPPSMKSDRFFRTVTPSTATNFWTRSVTRCSGARPAIRPITSSRSTTTRPRASAMSCAAPTSGARPSCTS